MASDRKLYLVVPNYVDPNTDIKLGDIIHHPTDASHTKVSRESAEFPHFEESHGIGGVRSHDLPTVSREIAAPWSSYAEMHNSRSTHVGADFLEVIHLEAHQEHTKAGLKKYTCDELETQVLNDTQEYIKKRAAAASVRAVLKDWGGFLRKPVYMITGIMIARGFDLDEPASNKHDLGANAKATLLLSPHLSIGVTAGTHKAWGSSQTVKRSKREKPFVFAFAVHKLRLKVFDKDVSIDPYTKGAKFGGLEGSSNLDNAVTKKQIEVTEEDIQDVDVGKEMEDFEEETENLEDVEITSLSMKDLGEILD